MYGITAQVSIYPLRQDKLSPAIDAVLETFAQHGVESQMGSMSTLVWGDDEKVFAALLEAFRKAAALGETVMVTTISNACPLSTKKAHES
ncbi:TPA: hypothetical protein EYP66_03715 [Candidatus Poribacteria bacterium]|nr:hypothetical protein [Candidatus Poribacteria bacterium]